MRCVGSNCDSCGCRKRSMRPTEYDGVLVSLGSGNAFADDFVSRLLMRLRKRVNADVFLKAGSGCERIETGTGT